MLSRRDLDILFTRVDRRPLFRRESSIDESEIEEIGN